MYLFEFPNDIKRYNYTYANLITSGTNSEDNVKYCFTTNIGAALKPSSENCYRVSRENSYTLKAYNPLIMYKDYEYDEGLSYYITFKAETDVSYFNVDAEVYKTYDIEYGATITPEVEPTKEGYTFSGWSEIPATMPAHDVTVTGTFTLDTGIEQIMSNANGDVMGRCYSVCPCGSLFHKPFLLPELCYSI